MNKLILVLLLLLLIPGCSSAEDNSQTQTAAPTAAEVLASPTLAEPVATETAATLGGADTEVVETADTQAVIDYEMQGSFNFFWEQANTEEGSPGYGLIRDRFPGSPGISSIASVGFGLTAYPIGIEKGYISYEEGQERAGRTLDTLLGMERVEGFYFHFVDMQTGERAWESEVSTIDTAILMMGVLTAGEYFGGEVESKAKEIYDGVNWPWFVDQSRNMFHMAYRPEEALEDQRGFAGHWDFYAEQLMLYVLAAGSETHPIDETTYYAFTRHYGKYGEGEAFIHSWFGSIFTYQYSHAWIDFREYTDREGVNWFDNSVAASLAQANFAADNAGEYNTLGPDAWGITASDGPNGYNGLYGAPPSGFDNNSHLIDDTIAPSGAIGSIIFLPQQAQQAMLNYYSIEQLKGEYGFLDAYNITEEWYAGDVIGIDKGVSLLMLANYENDLVYQIIMANEQILNGLNRLQIEKNE